MSRKSVTVQRIHAQLRRLEQKANCAGCVVMLGSEHIATVRFSYPRDGAGKLVVLVADWSADRPESAKGLENYSNWTPWQYGTANGYGYDKATAAMGGMTVGTVTLQDQGYDWSRQLRAAGYTVIQAI